MKETDYGRRDLSAGCEAFAVAGAVAGVRKSFVEDAFQLMGEPFGIS